MPKKAQNVQTVTKSKSTDSDRPAQTQRSCNSHSFFPLFSRWVRTELQYNEGGTMTLVPFWRDKLGNTNYSEQVIVTLQV